MPTEEQIRQLAYALWEQEGSPEGKDQEHYFRAKKMLEDQEKAHIVKLAPPPRTGREPRSPNSGLSRAGSYESRRCGRYRQPEPYC
jgi:hypothetical protein